MSRIPESEILPITAELSDSGRLAIGGCMTSDEGDDIEQDEHYSSGMESGSSFEDEPDKPALPVRLVQLEVSGTGFNGTAGNGCSRSTAASRPGRVAV